MLQRLVEFFKALEAGKTPSEVLAATDFAVIGVVVCAFGLLVGVLLLFMLGINIMIQRLVKFFQSREIGESPRQGLPAADFAAICLLVSAAHIEDGCDEREREALRRLAVEGFHLQAAEADNLLDMAANEEREASDLFRWTKRVNEAYGHEQKCALLEKMWQVVLSDGVIGDFEANLLRRVSGLLYIPDREAGEAKQRAMRGVTGGN